MPGCVRFPLAALLVAFTLFSVSPVFADDLYEPMDNAVEDDGDGYGNAGPDDAMYEEPMLDENPADTVAEEEAVLDESTAEEPVDESCEATGSCNTSIIGDVIVELTDPATCASTCNNKDENANDAKYPWCSDVCSGTYNPKKQKGDYKKCTISCAVIIQNTYDTYCDLCSWVFGTEVNKPAEEQPMSGSSSSDAPQAQPEAQPMDPAPVEEELEEASSDDLSVGTEEIAETPEE